MLLLVYSLSEHVRKARGSVAPMAAKTIHALLSGSAKFGVIPGGGGEAGWVACPITTVGGAGEAWEKGASWSASAASRRRNSRVETVEGLCLRD